VTSHLGGASVMRIDERSAWGALSPNVLKPVAMHWYVEDVTRTSITP